jgi:uncharacterized membrane protein YgdD (TMEM256/DUF423 family)
MRSWLFLAAVNGALAVLCGAFAAHGLKTRLSADMLSVFDTAARYHLIHSVAMGLAALTIDRPASPAAARPARIAAGLFLAGMVLFSGSLYLLALTGSTALGWVTPFGGLAFVAGWLALALAALKS